MHVGVSSSTPLNGSMTWSACFEACRYANSSIIPKKVHPVLHKKNHRQDFWCVLASIDASGSCTKMGDYGTGMAYENGTQTFYKTCCMCVQFFKKVIFIKFLKLSLFS